MSPTPVGPGTPRWWLTLLIERLVEDRRMTLHLVEPGGALFVSGGDFDRPGELEMFRDALQRLAPEVAWVLVPSVVQLDVLSPAVRAAMLARAVQSQEWGEIFTADNSADQMIMVRCPRCDERIQMSLAITMREVNGHLQAHAMVDPADVDLHDLSCNGRAAP